MKHGAWLVVFSMLTAPFLGAVVSHTAPAEAQGSAPKQGPSSIQNQSPHPPPPTQYTLPPEKRAKAIAYARIRYTLHFVGVAISIAIYWLIWRSKLAAVIRDAARKVSRKHFIQCLVFVPIFLVIVTVLSLPLDFYSDFVLEHRFGLSTQGLGSWMADWGKSFLISALLGILVAWILYGVVRRSPGRWWFYFWLVSIPLVLFLIWVEPYIIEPLFYEFTPLEITQPVLTERIQNMLSRAGLQIPRDHVYEMNASSKTKTVNAYVSGVSTSKRVVVWDTTLKKMTPDETLLVLGHEAGHYVLHHIPKEFALDEGTALILFYLGFVAINRIVERVGSRTGIEGVGDLASLPIMLLTVTVQVFLASPIIDGISRHYEHQADQFGLEVTYGVVPDPNSAEVHALQVLGEEDLADPDPNPFIKFWLYTHPPLDERIRFAASYKPWAEGKPLEFVRSNK
jgi:STE24 endopeptidase